MSMLFVHRVLSLYKLESYLIILFILSGKGQMDLVCLKNVKIINNYKKNEWA